MYKAKKDKKPTTDSTEPSTVTATTPDEPSTITETVMPNELAMAVEATASNEQPMVIETTTSNEPSAIVETVASDDPLTEVEMPSDIAQELSMDSRLIEANVKRTQIHDTISQLKIQIDEWFAIAPKEQYEDFDSDVGERLRAMYC